MSHEQLDALIKQLHANNELRVSSLIITFFGDAILPRGGAVSSRAVQTVMSRLGIEPGAVRTAFSRLASDGWVVREMIGRNSFYRLSSEGLAPFKSATKRIYAPTADPAQSPDWLLAIRDSATSGVPLPDALQTNAIAINSDSYLCCMPTDKSIEQLATQLESADWLVVQGDPGVVPDWLSARVASPELGAEYQTLVTRFTPLDTAIPVDTLDVMAARCLLLHTWRRLLLKTPELAAFPMPDGWPAEPCRQFVATLYHRLLPPSEVWLDTEATAPDGPLMAPTSQLYERFMPLR